MFELVHPNNRYAVKYKLSKLILHGVRDMDSLLELDPYPIAVCFFIITSIF